MQSDAHSKGKKTDQPCVQVPTFLFRSILYIFYSNNSQLSPLHLLTGQLFEKSEVAMFKPSLLN